MDVAAADAVKPTHRLKLEAQLFALSFAALFLELMLIRWVPAVVRLVAYYANLMLISSFLGLGLGALMARRRDMFRWFPALLVIDVGALLICQHTVLPVSTSEARFFIQKAQLVNYLTLILIFMLNTVLFVPLGQRIGRLFAQLPPLRAYTWDLGGSLAGTACFGLFSLLYFSPLLGLAIVMVVYVLLALAEGGGKPWSALLLPLPLAGALLATDRRAIWSPYHYITIAEMV